MNHRDGTPDDVALSRRSLLRSAAAGVAAIALGGCGRSGEEERAEDRSPARNPPPSVAAVAAMTVYRDPSCGCCEAWAALARQAGYQVKVVDHPDMAAIKRRFGVPDEVASCHTTIVDGYAIEGHVPFADVGHLLKQRPSGIKGIAVAGMPRGSPGMETPDGAEDPFQVMAFETSGKISVFRS